MRLYELAHRIATDIQMLCNEPSHRVTVIEFVRSGFDEDGQPIPHEQYQEDWLRCIDCENLNTPKCLKCREIHAVTHDMMDPIE
jgi:hypothetical protein